MPLLGRAAMLLGFDVDAPAEAEHDDWHTHEHLPERLSIPGFLRGTRWAALDAAPHYLVLYEVDRLETLGSAAYLERLNAPTPWTSRMMTHYRGMSRGLCTVERSCGLGVGQAALLVRFDVAPDAAAALVRWLDERILPALPSRPGLGGVHLLRGALAAEMTSEQRIRGGDTGVDRALLVTGYADDAVAALREDELGVAALEANGARNVSSGLYRAAWSLSADELQRGGPEETR